MERKWRLFPETDWKQALLFIQKFLEKETSIRKVCPQFQMKSFEKQLHWRISEHFWKGVCKKTYRIFYSGFYLDPCCVQ